MKKAILTGVVICSLILCSFAQQTPEIISSSLGLYTPETLVQNSLLGSGITITNVTYTGDDQSIGSFHNFNNDIGINEGLILSTGSVTDAHGIDCDDAIPCANMGNSGVASANTNGGSDADLLASLGGMPSINDAAIIEIEFIPQGDSMSLTYIFASEEYENFTCASFNDVMGLFLSGPGISGTFTNNAENIALIPGTNIPVSINSVNSGVASNGNLSGNCTSLAHSQYFIDNISAGFNVEYNGFTTPLSSSLSVIPGATYTLKIAIADVGDSSLDSALFLGLGSFRSNVISTSISYSNPFGYIAEGCGSMDIVLSIEEALDSDLAVPYTIIGDAILGTDFTMTPSVINFPAGTTSTIISINALEDTTIEGMESFDIAMQIEGEIENIPVSISDPYIDEYSYEDLDLGCGDDTVVLSLVTAPDVISAADTFTNDNSEIIAPGQIYYIDIDVAGVSAPTITHNMAVSACINIVNTAFIYETAVWLISPDGKIVSLTSFNAPGFIPNGGYYNTCFTSTAAQNITEGTSPFTGNWRPEGDLSNFQGSSTNGTWRLAITDVAPGFAPTFESWSITFDNNFYEAEYLWSPQIGLDCATCAEPVVDVTSNMTYYVTITDSYGCIKEDSVVINIVEELDPVVIDSVHIMDENCNGDPGSIELFLSGDIGDVEWNTGQDSSFADNLPAGAYSVTVDNGCGQDTTATYFIEAGLHFDLDVLSAPCGGTGSAAITSDETYDFLWSNGEIGTDISNLTVGTYTVFVSNSTCNVTETFDIVENNTTVLSAPSIDSENITHEDCNGSLGSIELFISGDFDNIAWNTGSDASSIDNLTAGIYSVTISNSCGQETMATYVIEPALDYDLIFVAAPCGGTGSANIMSSETYDISWSTGEIGTSISGLEIGTYTVSIASGTCNSIETFDIIEGTTSVLIPPSIDSENITHVDCNGSLGSIELFISGDVNSIEWSSGQETSFIDNLEAGTYTVTIDNGCGENTIATYIIEPSLDYNLYVGGVSCDTLGSAFVSSNEPYDISWSTGETGANISQLAVGTYTVTITNGICNSIQTFELSEPDCTNNLTGTVRLELGDDDCTLDALTVPSEYRMLSLFDGTNTQYEYTDSEGTYSFDDVALGNYDLTLEDYGNGNLLNCPSSPTIPFNISQNGTNNNNDFWLVKSLTLADLRVSVSNFGTPRPDFTNTAKIYCWNDGGSTAEGNTIVFTHAPEQTLSNVYSSSAFSYAYNIATSTVTITLPNMAASDYLIINVDLYIPTTANIGDVYNYYANIETISNEVNLVNNVASTQFNIVNSYDPNDKQVLPTGIGETGAIAADETELIFTINFQNEGTADALKVVLKDEIDTDVFDFASIRFLESSHPFEPSVEGNSTLVITYDDINLVPKEESEEGSKGFITFAINLKEDLPFGTEIKNGADIFFDFNDAIVTNETLNTVTDFTSTVEILSVDFNMFPNPANHKLQLSSKDEIVQVNIIDQLGKIVLQTNNYNTSEPLDIRTLTKGIYFVQVETKDGRKGVRKLTIIR